MGLRSKQYCFYIWGRVKLSNPFPNSKVVPPEELWAFRLGNGGSWNNVDQSFDPAHVFPTLTRPMDGAGTYSSIGGFLLGGNYGSHGSSKNPVGEGHNALPGLLFYNFTGASWTNISTTALYTGAWKMGVSQYVPIWGTESLLVSFGGNDYPWSNTTVFDAETRKWYAQTASGNAPPSRGMFCYIGVGSHDNNTYGE